MYVYMYIYIYIYIHIYIHTHIYIPSFAGTPANMNVHLSIYTKY